MEWFICIKRWRAKKFFKSPIKLVPSDERGPKSKNSVGDLIVRGGHSLTTTAGYEDATTQRTPLSKQRNKHLQTTLIEAAKMAPRYSPALALLYDRERQKGNANRATLAVARKLVAYLMAVDRGQRNFQVVETSHCIVA